MQKSEKYFIDAIPSLRLRLAAFRVVQTKWGLRRKKANLTGLSKKAITKVSASMMALRESHYWNKVHRLSTPYSGNARRRSLRRSGSPRWIRIPHHQMQKAL